MLADIFSVKRDTISNWIKRWEREKGEGLLDKVKSGHLRHFTEEEEKIKTVKFKRNEVLFEPFK